MKKMYAIFAIIGLMNLVGCSLQTYEEAVIEDRNRELKRIDEASKYAH